MAAKTMRHSTSPLLKEIGAMCHRPCWVATACSAWLFFGLASTDAADWLTEGGNNARSFATADALPVAMKEQWRVQAPAIPRLAWSSAEGRTIEGIPLAHRIRFDDAFRTVIAGGRVYFGSTVDHGVHCYELATGRRLWTCFTGGPVRLSPTVFEDRVYFGSDDGRAYCVEAATGNVIWQRQIAPRDEWLLARGELISKWPVRTGVMIHQGVAYLGAGIFPHEDVYLFGLDPATGRPVWREDNISAQDAGRNDLSPQGYLLAEENRLFVPSGGSLPAVFDIGDRKLLHKRTHSWRGAAGVVGGTRALLSDGQLYTVGEHHILGMDQQTGDIGYGWFDGRLLATQADAAYILTGSRVARLDRAAYTENSRRRRKLETDIVTVARDARSKQGEEAEALKTKVRGFQQELKDIAEIGVVWSTSTTDDGALLAAGNAIVVGGQGRVAAYSKDDGSEVWSTAIDGTVRGLAVADGHLLASTDLGAIVCFGDANTPATSSTTDAPGVTAGANDVLRAAASEILSRTGVKAGYCLVVGAEEGRLAEELARHSELKIYCVEP
ncbi:MAG: hypothetical protein B7Z55_09385, partial [Planctomycetales bacterium 12-60-4]